MTMCATVLEAEDGRLLVLDQATGQEVVVHFRCGTFQPGERVRIFYNGQMTRSLPPQIFAMSVSRVCG